MVKAKEEDRERERERARARARARAREREREREREKERESLIWMTVDGKGAGGFWREKNYSKQIGESGWKFDSSSTSVIL